MRKILVLLLFTALVLASPTGALADQAQELDAYAASETSASGSSILLYTVVKGDTMKSVASEFGLDVATLAKVNNLKSNATLYQGQMLVISAKTLDEFMLYTLIPGDTIYSVAANHEVTAEAIVNLNKLPHFGGGLTAGQTLMIPYPEAPVVPVVPSPPAEPDPVPVNPQGGVSALIEFAKGFLGYDYVYGTNGPKTFDCSGFTSYVFKKFGVSLPRTSRDQGQVGVYVPKDQLKAGDLVLFTGSSSSSIGHVGIYIGGGQFIHASNPQRGVVIDKMSSTYYVNHYVTARRVPLS